MRTILLCAVSTAVLVVGCSVTAGARAEADQGCGAADALKAAKLYDEALATYASVLAKDPVTTCAHASIDEIASIRKDAAGVFAEGRVYEAAQQKAQAVDAYARALAADPEFTDARNALLSLTDSAPADTTFAAVYALSRAGFRDDATAKLKETLQQHPSSRVPPDLTYLVANNKSVRQWLRSHGPVLSWLDIPKDTLALGGVVLACLGLIGLRLRPRRPRMDIEDLVEGATKGVSGVALSGRLEEALCRLWVGPNHPNLQFVEGPGAALTPPPDIALPAQVKLLAMLLDWLFPPRLIVVGGYLQYLADRGAGITLRLLQKPQSGVIETITIWQDEFASRLTPPKPDSPEAFDDLVEPAAIWLLYRLSERAGHAISPPYPKVWRSHAAFRAGVRAQKLGDMVAASRRYHRAVTLDPGNIDALINLAILEADQKKYDRAVARLSHVQAVLNKTPGYLNDLRWYIVRYQLAASYDYAEDPKSAEPEARALLGEMDQAIAAAASDQETSRNRGRVTEVWNALLAGTIQRGRRHHEEATSRARQSLITFLTENRASTVVMYATILRENKKAPLAQAQLSNLPSSDRSSLLAYNLACYHSEAAADLAGARRVEELNQARELLIEALEGQPERAEEAERDPSLDVLRHDLGSKFNRLVKTYKP